MKHGKWRLALLAAVILLSGCGLLPQEAQLPHAPIAHEVEEAEHTMTVVMRGDIAVTKTVRCEYRPALSESLAFSIGGEYIHTFFVQPGDTVRAGDLLAELELGDLEPQEQAKEQELARLQLQYTQAEEKQTLAVKRAQILLDQAPAGTARREAKESLERTENTYQKMLRELEDAVLISEKGLEEIRDKIADRRIYASIDGSVTYVKNLQEGDISSEYEKVVTISNVASSVFLVTGEDAALFAVGDTAKINYDKNWHDCTVVDPASLGLEQTDAQIACILLDIPDPSLDEGTRGSIEAVLDHAEDVLYVHASAIKMIGDQPVVYYLDEDGMKNMKEVETGLNNGEIIEIRSGLAEGEAVIDE